MDVVMWPSPARRPAWFKNRRRGLASFAIRLDVSNHDGIVNQQANDDDQTEHTHRGCVRAMNVSVAQPRATDRQTPTTRFSRQRQKQQDEDQHAPHGGIACQKINSTNKTGQIAADGEINLVWKHPGAVYPIS